MKDNINAVSNRTNVTANTKDKSIGSRGDQQALTLLKTDRAQEWLDQFRQEDRQTAITMLESLQLIRYDNFERDLIAEFKSFILTARHPVAVYAVREVRNLRYFNSAGHPKAVSASRSVGSEGELAHLVRDLSRDCGVLDHPDIETLRSCKVRTVVALNDVIGSGHQVRDFLQSIYNNRSIKSWVSGGLMEIAAVVHSSSRAGRLHVLRGKPKWSLRSANELVGLTNDLDESITQEIRSICERYAKRNWIREDWWFGYKGVFSGTVFEHKCPNTSPGIIWCKTKKWKPLFNQRGSLSYPVWPIVATPEHQLRRLFISKGRPTLDALTWVSTLGVDGVLKVALLALASQRIRHHDAQAEHMRVSNHKLRELSDACVANGWLTTGGRLTENGRAILNYANKHKIKSQVPKWSGTDDFYFYNDVGGHDTP